MGFVQSNGYFTALFARLQLPDSPVVDHRQIA